MPTAENPEGTNENSPTGTTRAQLLNDPDLQYLFNTENLAKSDSVINKIRRNQLFNLGQAVLNRQIAKEMEAMTNRLEALESNPAPGD